MVFYCTMKHQLRLYTNIVFIEVFILFFLESLLIISKRCRPISQIQNRTQIQERNTVKTDIPYSQLTIQHYYMSWRPFTVLIDRAQSTNRTCSTKGHGRTLIPSLIKDIIN